MFDFNVLNLILILVAVKFYILFLLDESFLHQVGLKLTLMVLLGVFLDVHTVLGAGVYGVIHAIEEAQKMGLTGL